MNDPNENRPGYKPTKVGWIPEEWRVASASTFAPFVTSGSRGWAEFYADCGALFMRITNLRRETPRPDLADSRYVSVPPNSAEGRRTLLQKDDILISITADLGIIGHISEHFPSPAYISQHLAILRFPKELTHDRQYLAYSLAGDRMVYHFYKVTDQGAKAGLNLDTIRQLPLILPPLPEQRKIAAILSAWDDGIEQTRALIAAKKQQKKALMQQLLTGKRRLPGFTGGWKHVRLKSVASIPKKVQLCSVEGETLLTVKLHCLGIERNECIHPKLTEKGRPYFKRHAGELLIGRQNFHNGGFGILPKNFNGLIASSAITSLIVDSTKISERFLLLVWSNPDYYKHVGHRMDGTGQKELSEKQIMRLDIPLPPLSEQRAIAAVLDTADREIAAIEAKLAALEQQKKGLMQKLLTGQVRVKG